MPAVTGVNKSGVAHLVSPIRILHRIAVHARESSLTSYPDAVIMIISSVELQQKCTYGNFFNRLYPGNERLRG